MNTVQLKEHLLQSLVHERGGVLIYRTALDCALNDDLREACLSALTISKQACLDFAAKYTWEASARAFVDNMADIRNADPASDTVQFTVKHPGLVA